MKTLLSCLLLMGCAYGSNNEQPIYGHRAPENYDGGSPTPPFTDPNANDPYYTMCFVQVINQYEAGVSVFYVCDGVLFNVSDEVDPGPENKQ